MKSYRDAARRRAEQVRALADRPSQRRCAEDPTSRAGVLVPTRIEVREAADGSGRYTFEGWASVYERSYEMWDMFGPYEEIVSAGSGAESLARPDLDVPLVLAHDSLRRIARTTNGSLLLDEDEVGLHVLAPALDPADADVAYIVPKLLAGLVSEMSYMFRITSGQWSPDYMEFRINTYDIHRGDVAIVGFGANPHTSGGVREAPKARDVRRMLLDLALASRKRTA